MSFQAALSEYPKKTSDTQQIIHPLVIQKKVALYVKREDMLHPYISGNKFRKLKYNIIEAARRNKHCLLTFGGAFSNHIAATAFAGKEFGFKTVGIIRGEELSGNSDRTAIDNPTLQFASECGMQLEFVSRSDYRKRSTTGFINKFKNQYRDCYVIPEGGTNKDAVRGCEEILNEKDGKFDYICVSVGTGGTIAGLINTAKKHQKILGFSALKGSFLKNDIIRYLRNEADWKLIDDFHFGAYAKVTKELIAFMNDFKAQTNILLDPVYTGKMMYGVMQLVSEGYFAEGAKILAIHTGGLQGIAGMNLRLSKKRIPTINT